MFRSFMKRLVVQGTSLKCNSLVIGRSGLGIYNLSTNQKASFSSKIYTRTGDKGRTSTFTGERREKSDEIFEALGTVDELSCALGISREFISDSNPRSNITTQLEIIQCNLQDLASMIATPKSSARETHLKLTSFDSKHVVELEKWIDKHSEGLPELKNFILPSGGKSSTHLHLARTICRRAERRAVPLIISDQVDEIVLKYLNRLSDYLFTAARVAAKEEGFTETIYRKTKLD